jgi:hypothetical protein
LTAAALLTLFALAGCAASHASTTRTAASTDRSDSAPPAGPLPAGWLELAANPSGQLTFSKRLLIARRREVKIAFTNHSRLPHNLTIATSSRGVIGATPTFRAGARALTLDLRPGTYTFYCSVPGHRGGGMQGKLVVK